MNYTSIDPRALLVRSALAWAIRTVELHEASQTSAPGPRLSQISLRSYMSMTDPETILSIVQDIASLGDDTAELYAAVRAGWGEEPPRRPSRRGPRDEALHVANEMQMAARRHVRGRELSILELGCKLPSFTRVAEHFPGSTPQSIRDDFERIAVRFFRAEQKIACDVSAFVVKLGKLRGVCR